MLVCLYWLTISNLIDAACFSISLSLIHCNNRQIKRCTSCDSLYSLQLCGLIFNLSSDASSKGMAFSHSLRVNPIRAFFSHSLIGILWQVEICGNCFLSFCQLVLLLMEVNITLIPLWRYSYVFARALSVDFEWVIKVVIQLINYSCMRICCKLHVMIQLSGHDKPGANSLWASSVYSQLTSWSSGNWKTETWGFWWRNWLQIYCWPQGHGQWVI